MFSSSSVSLRRSFLYGITFAVIGFAGGCSHNGSGESEDSSIVVQSIQVDSVDSLIVIEDPTPVEPPKVSYSFAGTQEILSFISNKSDASLYEGGIIPVIAKEVPKYANQLLSELETYSKFIVVDKASMRVILYDKYGQELKAYGMACAKNYGTKHKKADSRTPEGFFSLEGKYDSTDWLFTDDNGHTSPKKGQFGPRFLRIKTPVSMQIGIHGTGSPWSIGHRASHGCIRITNENILELYDLVEKGMPVMVLPGKRDRAVNREEGYDIPYFPTEGKYAMSDKEKKEKVNPEKADFSEKKDTTKNVPDSEVKTDTISPVSPDINLVKEENRESPVVAPDSTANH